MKTSHPTVYSRLVRSLDASHYDKKENINDTENKELSSVNAGSRSDTFIQSQNSLLFTNNNPIVDSICRKLIHLIYDDTLTKTCYSKLLSKSLSYNYTYLSNLFTNTKGTTIQQFIIYHKIERVKKLLRNGESSLTEISYLLNYSSVAHLSNQFKKVTGLSPSQYKLMRHI